MGLELLVVLIVLGGLWAALLLPSFLDSRHDAPLTSTKSFDRRLAKLASLRAESIDPIELKRRHLQARRRRVMVALVGAALITLVAAILRGSVPLLLLSLAFDGMFVAYLAALNAVHPRSKQAARLPNTPEPLGYGELRLVSDDDFPQAANR
jgi:hypothetical protein